MPLMPQDLVDLFARNIVAGDIDGIMQHVATDLTVYLGGNVMHFSGADEIRSLMLRLKSEASTLRPVNLSGEVVAQSLPRNGRFRFFVKWRHDLGPGELPRETRGVYYCTLSQGRPVIRMIDLDESVFGDWADWYPRKRALSAREMAGEGWGEREGAQNAGN